MAVGALLERRRLAAAQGKLRDRAPGVEMAALRGIDRARNFAHEPDALPPESAPEVSVAVEPAPEAAAVPSNPAEVEKAAKAALASDLADIIHQVLSTTSFASKATIQTRGFTDPMSDAPIPLDPPADPDELPDEALPHHFDRR